MALLTVLLAALAAPAAAAATGHSLIVVSKSGLMHLDASGALLAWRPEAFQKWQKGSVATNPHNGTVCWVRKPEEPAVGFVVRCATLERLNQTWDLPLPLSIGIHKVTAIAYDWVTENWYLAVKESPHLLREDGAFHHNVRRSYVCGYQFDECLQLDEFVASSIGSFFVAYDISNRMLFRIRVDDRKSVYRLEAMRLDGSGVRELETHIRDPHGLAVDPVRRQVYWLDRTSTYGNFTDVNKIDYDGKNMGRVRRLDDRHDITAVDAVGGGAVVAWNDMRFVSAIHGDTGEKTDLVAGAVNGETIPALAEVKDLLTVKIFSPETQLDTTNRCSAGGGGCQDLCVPTVVNGTAEASCFCPGGHQLVELACRKPHPAYAVVVGATALQVVDLQTEEMSTILSNLTDGTKVDVFRLGGEEFLLFWVDAGSLFRGRWSPGGPVSDVQLLVQATETVRVMEVAVDWSQRHLLWLKRDDSNPKNGSVVIVEMSPLDSSYAKTLFVDSWEDQHGLVVHGSVFMLIQNKFVGQNFQRRKISRERAACANSTLDLGDMIDIVTDASLAPNPQLDRMFWIDGATQSIEYLYSWWMQLVWSVKEHSRLLTHPSLADAGGLDAMHSRVFWTERATGQLWTADSETGGGVRALPAPTGGRALRLIQPWRRPSMVQVCDESRAGCSHFCLRGGGGLVKPAAAECDCPDGFQLGDDQKTCQEAASDSAQASGGYLGCTK